MNWEKTIEIIFEAILLSAVGFMATQLFEMESTLSSVNAKVDSTDKRVTRIAEALPEIKARVAWEEVNEPLKGAVIKLENIEKGANMTETEVIVYDSVGKLIKNYKILLSNK